jgi:hypothetical protein
MRKRYLQATGYSLLRCLALVLLMGSSIYLYTHREMRIVSLVSGYEGVLWIVFTLVSLAISVFPSNLAPIKIESVSVQSSPSFRLQTFAEFIFSPKVYGEIFQPALRDLFDEYCEALKEGRPRKARWVCIRGYWSFWSAVAAQLPISVLKTVYKIWKATR